MHSQFDGLRADLPSIIVHALGDTLRSRGDAIPVLQVGKLSRGGGIIRADALVGSKNPVQALHLRIRAEATGRQNGIEKVVRDIRRTARGGTSRASRASQKR